MKEVQRLAPEAHKVRSAFIEGRAGDLARVPASRSRRRAKRLSGSARVCSDPIWCCRSMILSLPGCTVADVLADPDRFEGETLADPLEGIEYGPLQGQDHAAAAMARHGSIALHTVACATSSGSTRRRCAAAMHGGRPRGTWSRRSYGSAIEADLDPDEMRRAAPAGQEALRRRA